MFNVGGGELIVIALIALIVLGPQRLPDAARQVGKVMGDLRRFSAGFQNEMRSAFVDEETATAISSARRDLLGPTGRGSSPVSRAISAVSSQGDRDAAPANGSPPEVAAPVAAAATPAPTARKAAPPRPTARPTATRPAKGTTAAATTNAATAKAATTKVTKAAKSPAKATKAATTRAATTRAATTRAATTRAATTKVAKAASAPAKETKASKGSATAPATATKAATSSTKPAKAIDVPKRVPPRTNGT